MQAEECNTIIRSSIELQTLKGSRKVAVVTVRTSKSSSENNRHAIHSQSEEFDNARDKHLTVGHCRFEADGADTRGHEIFEGLYFRS